MIFATKGLLDKQESNNKIENSKLDKVSTSEIKDGEYYGEADGYGGPIKVKVTIKDGKMTKIDVVSHSETPEYFKAAREVIDRMLASGSVDVDTVSGATISSNALKKAVADALSKAGIKTGEFKNSNSKPSNSIQFANAGGCSARAGRVGISARNVEDGTYEGFGYDYGGAIRVIVTVSGGLITAINVISHNETTSGPTNYYARGASVISRILGKPGKSVDTVSGATMTSRGIIDAVNAALSKARSKKTIVPANTGSNGEEGGIIMPVVPTPQPPTPSIPSDMKLDDGEWFGTATEGMYYTSKGPNVVKVVIKNGKIESVESVAYTDDDETSGIGYGKYPEKKKKLFKLVVGMDLKGVNDVQAQLIAQKGAAYDVMTSATRTGRGHISAIKEALLLSAKSWQAKQNGQGGTTQGKRLISITVSEKPSGTQYFGKPIDLTATKLKLLYSDQSGKEIAFDEIDKYGITCSWKNGAIVTLDTPGVENGNYIEVKFDNEETKTHAQYNLPLKVYKKVCYATKAEIEYIDGTKINLPLNENNFRYDFDPEQEIKMVTLYENDKKLVEGKYTENNNAWGFDMGNPGEGFEWRWTSYRIDLKKRPLPAIKSFKVEAGNMEYNRGDKLDLSGIKIVAELKNGTSKTYTWKEASAAGFKASPGNNSELKEAGMQTVKISVNSAGNKLEQEFSVKVKDEGGTTAPVTDHVPNKIEIYNGSDKLYSETIDGNDFKISEYKMLTKKMEISESLKNLWENNSFDIKVYNKSGQLLEIETVKVEKFVGHNTLDVKIKNYKAETAYEVGYLRVLIKWQKADGKSSARAAAPKAAAAPAVAPAPAPEVENAAPDGIEVKAQASDNSLETETENTSSAVIEDKAQDLGNSAETETKNDKFEEQQGLI